MSTIPSIQIARFYKRNAANNYAQQPPRWNCDCCGANLAAWAITDGQGRVWGKTCYLKAIGKDCKKPNWTAMEKAAAIVGNCWPVGAVIRHANGRSWTVTAAAWVGIVNGRPVPWVTVQRASGSVADISPLNLVGMEILSVVDAGGKLLYGQHFNSKVAEDTADWVMGRLPCLLADVVDHIGESQWWISREDLRAALKWRGVDIVDGGVWDRVAA